MLKVIGNLKIGALLFSLTAALTMQANPMNINKLSMDDKLACGMPIYTGIKSKASAKYSNQPLTAMLNTSGLFFGGDALKSEIKHLAQQLSSAQEDGLIANIQQRDFRYRDKNRLFILVASSIMLAFIIGYIITFYYYWRAKRQKNELELLRSELQIQKTKAEEANQLK